MAVIHACALEEVRDIPALVAVTAERCLSLVTATAEFVQTTSIDQFPCAGVLSRPVPTFCRGILGIVKLVEIYAAVFS